MGNVNGAKEEKSPKWQQRLKGEITKKEKTPNGEVAKNGEDAKTEKSPQLEESPKQ